MNELFIRTTATLGIAAAAALALPASAEQTAVAIKTADAPAAVGPYSQAVSMGPMVFVSGQLGLEPATGKLVDGGVESEAKTALANLAAILKGAGLSMQDVVKTTIYVTDIADFGKVNAIYGVSFPTGTLPARATVWVAALPKGGHVEIEAVAMRR